MYQTMCTCNPVPEYLTYILRGMHLLQPLHVVYLQCACNVTASRYVIVQFPIVDVANFCEVEVFVRGKSIRLSK